MTFILANLHYCIHKCRCNENDESEKQQFPTYLRQKPSEEELFLADMRRYVIGMLLGMFLRI